MRPEVQKAVLAVLRRSQYGFADVHASYCVHTGLGRFKRFVNWAAEKIGADRQPFKDPYNYHDVSVLHLSCVANEALVDEAMKELAGTPACRICGSGNLQPDPAGYYCDALDYDGTALLCLDHEKKR